MNKERKLNVSNKVVVFNRDVNAEELNALFEDFNGDIIINGELYVDRNLHIKCDNLYVTRLTTGTWTKIGFYIIIEGNLFVDGDIDCYDIEVNGSIYSNGEIDSLNIIIAEDFYAKRLSANDREVAIGGDFECDKAEYIKDITVLGSTYVKSLIAAEHIDLRGFVQAQGIWDTK